MCSECVVRCSEGVGCNETVVRVLGECCEGVVRV